MKASLLPGSTLSSKFYSEDIVFRINKNGNFEHGLVIENYDDASSEDEEDFINELLSIPPLKRGHIRVAWHPNGRKQVVAEKKVNLLNRCFSPGDIVKKIGNGNNLGFVFHSNVLTTIQVMGSKKVIVNVKSEDLVPLDEYAIHRVIYYQDWVGIIKEVKTKLNLIAADGSRCSFHSEEPPVLDDANDHRDFSSEFKKFDYYPGQQLYGPAHNFAKSEWKTLRKDTKNALNNLTQIIEVTVESTAVTQIKVQWLCPAFSQNPSAKSSPPSEFITGNNLAKVRKLDCFFSNTVQIGDRMYYTLKDSDLILNLSDWKENIFHFLQPEAGLANHEEPSQKTAENVKANEEVMDDDQEYESIESDDEGHGVNNTCSSHPRKERAKRKKLKNPTFTTTQGYTRRVKKAKRSKRAAPQLVLNTGDRVSTEILAISTSVDVIWQDGIVEKDLPSSSLIPVHHIDNHDFFPGDFVVDNKENLDCHCQEYGVVRKVDHKERLVEVEWVRSYVEGSQGKPELLRVEQLSVYDIKDHPDFRYRLGAIVIKIPNSGESQRSWAGQVMELNPIGMVQVKWADGSTSACYPQELYRIGGYDSDDLLEDYDSLTDESSWQTESEMSLLGSDDQSLPVGKEKIKDEEELQSDVDKLKNYRQNLSKNLETMKNGLSRIHSNFSKSNFKTKCPIMFLSKLSDIYNNCKQFDTIFGTSRFNADLDQFKRFLESTAQNDRASTNNTATAASTSSGMLASQMCKQLMEEIESAYVFLQMLFDRLLEEEQGEAKPEVEKPPSQSPVVPEADKCCLGAELVDQGQFTLLEEVPSHHAFKSSTFMPASHSCFIKTLKKELQLLSNLPEGIVVKGYQERMDLFSVMIKGPRKTPYEDGLFFFDFQLLGDYPKSPPLCHYISYCSGRLNPNLYDTGKVCVSLLGTWDGKGTEVWNPASSSLLQVLVSIQGLILVTEPYFNEANFERQRGTHQGKENSILYNEMVVIKLAQSMTTLLHQPPQVFRQEIADHFLAHAPGFLHRLENILAVSESLSHFSLKYSPSSPSPQEVVVSGSILSLPTYLQLPASRGFCLSLRKALLSFKAALDKLLTQPS